MLTFLLPEIHIDDFDKSNLECLKVYDRDEKSSKNQLEKLTKFHKNSNLCYPGYVNLEAYRLPSVVTTPILRQLPKSILDEELPDISYIKFQKKEIPDMFLPHVDFGRRAAINIFLSKKTNLVVTHYKADNSLEKLSEIESLQVIGNVTLAMDVRTIHSAILLDKSCDDFISISFRKIRFLDILKFYE